MGAINEYANCMFRHERLNDAWLDDCAAYLRSTFGDLRGRTVVDYGFGRGNWSVAFLRAGARRVIAIDAAEDNVLRLADYCLEHELHGIEVVHGNILEDRIEAKADIVWLYGVLHHVENAEIFLSRLAPMAPLFYVYAYDRGSLRQFVVETGRRLTGFSTEAEFRRHALCLTRPARLRARDDLMAPHIEWYEAAELSSLLSRYGLNPVSRAAGFGRNNPEFVPHEWLALRGPPGARGVIEMLDPPRPYANDVEALYDMVEAVVALGLDAAELRRVGLGLFNAHFTALASGGVEAAITEDFLHLYHVMTSRTDAAALPVAASPLIERVERARMRM